MIPFIRSLSELKAITESRIWPKEKDKENKINNPKIKSPDRKTYLRSIEGKEVKLPDLKKIVKRKWIPNKESVSKLLDDLDYNNQIQPSYNLTLLARQYNRNHKDAA